MIPMNLHHLYYFWVVAREGSVAKACQTLFLSQPAVSAQIIQLEKALGRKLFDRHKRRLHLTSEGEFVLGYADEIFSRSQELLDGLRDRPRGRQQAIQLGMVDQVPKQVLREVVRSVLKFHPQTRLTVHEGLLPSMLSELRSHALDLVVSDVDVPMGSGTDYVRTEIGELKALWVAAPSWAKQIRRFPDDLSQVPLLVPTPGSPLRTEVERFLHKTQVVPNVLAEVQDVELLRFMVLDGQGAAPMHVTAVREDLKRGKLKPLGGRNATLTHPVWLLARQRHRQNPIGDYLLNRFRWKD